MFIARQPIFKRNLEVYGYELLFRGDANSQQFDGTSAQSATAAVVGGLFELGIDQIVDGKFAFINFDERFVMSNSLELIPPDRLVVEMLENIKVDENLVRRLRQLKGKGYKIALDDFVEDIEDYPLVPVADIIKFDLLETPLDSIRREVEIASQNRKILLAEKIESKDEFEQAKEMGFHLFQGYFFSKPRVRTESRQEKTDRTQYLRVLDELSKEEPSYCNLADIIRNDVNLAYRLLRVSSSRSGEEDLYSIRKALTFMGLNEIERWINVLMLQDIGKNQPLELTNLALVRSKFAELIVVHSNMVNKRYEASLMGLFSTLDAMLDLPLLEALEDIAIPEDIKIALTKNEGDLAPIFNLLIAYETGDWEQASKITSDLKLDDQQLMNNYLVALNWANSVLKNAAGKR